MNEATAHHFKEGLIGVREAFSYVFIFRLNKIFKKREESGNDKSIAAE